MTSISVELAVFLMLSLLTLLLAGLTKDLFVGERMFTSMTDSLWKLDTPDLEDTFFAILED